MTAVLQFLGSLFVVAGSVFLALGGLGVLRMPDIYNRIQAGTKATTLGTLLTLLGVALLMPGWSVKLFLVMVFLTFTNPLSSQVLARAAHRAGVPLASGSRADALAEDERTAVRIDGRSDGEVHAAPAPSIKPDSRP